MNYFSASPTRFGVKCVFHQFLPVIIGVISMLQQKQQLPPSFTILAFFDRCVRDCDNKGQVFLATLTIKRGSGVNLCPGDSHYCRSGQKILPWISFMIRQQQQQSGNTQQQQLDISLCTSWLDCSSQTPVIKPSCILIVPSVVLSRIP